MTFDAFDVVVVPFPFIDISSKKRRPALVLSKSRAFNKKLGHSVLAMVTSVVDSDWPLDVQIDDLDSAGLPHPSVVRMKIFTLDNRLIIGKLGKLAQVDTIKVEASLLRLFNVGGDSAYMVSEP